MKKFNLTVLSNISIRLSERPLAYLLALLLLWQHFQR
jgi:hypothetical protein